MSKRTDWFALINNPEKIKVYDFLERISKSSGDSGKIFIPENQRDYEWGKEQWDILWTDLISVDKGVLFLGPILTISGDNGTEIQDGQQRIVTIFIMLHALCRVFDEVIAPMMFKTNVSKYLSLKKNYDFKFSKDNRKVTVKNTDVENSGDDIDSIKKIVSNIQEEGFNLTQKKDTIYMDSFEFDEIDAVKNLIFEDSSSFRTRIFYDKGQKSGHVHFNATTGRMQKAIKYFYAKFNQYINEEVNDKKKENIVKNLLVRFESLFFINISLRDNGSTTESGTTIRNKLFLRMNDFGVPVANYINFRNKILGIADKMSDKYSQIKAFYDEINRNVETAGDLFLHTVAKIWNIKIPRKSSLSVIEGEFFDDEKNWVSNIKTLTNLSKIFAFMTSRISYSYEEINEINSVNISNLSRSNFSKLKYLMYLSTNVLEGKIFYSVIMWFLSEEKLKDFNYISEIEYIVYFQFLFSRLGEGRSNKVEKSIKKNFAKGMNLSAWESVKKELNYLIDPTNNESYKLSEIESDISEIIYTKNIALYGDSDSLSDRDTVFFILFWPELNNISNSVNIDLSSMEVDHFYPDCTTEKNHWSHRLGNMYIIGKSDNGSKSDKEPSNDLFKKTYDKYLNFSHIKTLSKDLSNMWDDKGNLPIDMYNEYLNQKNSDKAKKFIESAPKEILKILKKLPSESPLNN